MRTPAEMYNAVHRCQRQLSVVFRLEPRHRIEHRQQRSVLAPLMGLEQRRQHRGSSRAGTLLHHEARVTGSEVNSFMVSRVE